MNYRSIADLASCIREGLYKIPKDVDLIVGIPRSGTLAGSIIALSLNIKLTDVINFVSNAPLQHGQTRQTRFPELTLPSDAKHVLVVDDSADSGDSLTKVKELIAGSIRIQQVSYCAIFVTPRATSFIEVYFEVLASPRLFEWNLMHRQSLAECCVDIDGVLCLDPNEEENDDGKNYMQFLTCARRMAMPSYPIGHLVTSRLERYRSQTEEWLNKNGVVYKELHMLNLPDAETRRRLGNHSSFKAEVFRKQRDAKLFIESEVQQAIDIARLSGKPVLCFSTQQMFEPNVSYTFIEGHVVNLIRRVIRKIGRVAKKIIK